MSTVFAWVISMNGLFVVLFFFILSGESIILEAATYLIFLVSNREFTFFSCYIRIYWHYWAGGSSSIMMDAAIC